MQVLEVGRSLLVHSLPRDFFNRHVLTFFEASVLKEVRIYVRYLHNISTMLILKFQNKADYAS